MFLQQQQQQLVAQMQMTQQALVLGGQGRSDFSQLFQVFLAIKSELSKNLKEQKGAEK